MRLYPRCWVLWIAVALSACGATPPLTALSEGDRDQLESVLQAALEKNRTGEGANWDSPATGRRGTVMPLRTYKGLGGRDCREYQQTATVEGETDIAFGTACRDEAGTWRIVSAPSRYHPRYSAGYRVHDSDIGYRSSYLYAPYRYPHRRNFRY